MPWPFVLTVALLAVVAAAARPGVSPSRRVLAACVVVLVPVAGLWLAVMVRRSRGGAVEREPELVPEPSRLSPGDAARLGAEPGVIDRLVAGDAGERLAALVTLSSAADAEAIAALRWSIEHGRPEVVLDAALTLEEIELRCEARLAAAKVALRASPAPDAMAALAVVQAAAALVLNRLADATMGATLLATAREAHALVASGAAELMASIEHDLRRIERTLGRRRSALRQVAPCGPSARRVSGEIDLGRRSDLVRRTRESRTMRDVREVAAAALLT